MASDVEREITKLLAERADDVRPPADVSERILRRARRRRIETAFASSVVVVGLVAAAVVGTRALIAPSTAGNDVRPGQAADDSFAVWPQTTRAEAKEAQQCADRGDTECTWQLGINEVVRRYATTELGFAEVWFYARGFSDRFVEINEGPVEREVDMGLTDEVGPLTMTVAECSPRQAGSCRAAHLELERLLRPDVTGVWFVTEADPMSVSYVQEIPSPIPPPESPVPVPPMPQGLGPFVDAFMQARIDGPGAERFLGREARELYESASGGLSLYGYTAARGTTYEIGGWETDDRSTASQMYRVVVRIHTRGSPVTRHETLLIEHLASAGWPYDHMVWYAERNE